MGPAHLLAEPLEELPSRRVVTERVEEEGLPDDASVARDDLTGHVADQDRLAGMIVVNMKMLPDTCVALTV